MPWIKRTIGVIEGWPTILVFSALSLLADQILLNRISKFYGGIVTGERSNVVGAALNVEELDIFTNPDFVEPETIFEDDNAVVSNGLFDFAYDGSTLYGLGEDGSGKNKIWKVTTASVDNPGAWAAEFTSSVSNSFDVEHIPSMVWHEQTESSTQKSYLYYTGNPGVSNTQLYRYGDLGGSPTETTTDVNTTAMLLTGRTTTTAFNSPMPRIRLDGEIFIGHGNFVAKIDESGNFTEKAFTLPVSWNAVDFAAVSGTLYILTENTKEPNVSKIFIWDTTATQQFDDVVIMPTGGPQAIINHNEVVRVFCVDNNVLRIYALDGKRPIKTHELRNIQDNTATADPGSTRTGRPVPVHSVFVKNNIVYFGLWKTDKTGLYALGQVEEGRPLALVLAKRFKTNDYSNHRPVAAAVIGPNFYASAYDGNSGVTVYQHMRIEGNNSPTRSSNAVYESVWIDLNSPEILKDWSGFVLVTKPMPTSCNVKIDARVDNDSNNYTSTVSTSSLKTLTNSDDQTTGGQTADTFWYRSWESLNGRAIQLRLRFTSSTTSKATLFLVGLFSREHNVI